MDSTLTTAQVATLFGKTPRTIANWVKKGEFGDEGVGFIRLPGPRGAFLIDDAAVERMWHHGTTECRVHTGKIRSETTDK